MSELASPLRAWESFYVIVGTSAGALTGLQFVVMTLIAETERSRRRSEAVSAFGSPNVVHFCAGLLISALLSVPWMQMAHAGWAVAATGAGGAIYCAIVVRRAMRQQDYQPVFEDWLFHTVLPALAYVALLVAGSLFTRDPAAVLFPIAGATLLLVFVGIHNAWDTVMYVTVQMMPPGGDATAGPGVPASSSGSPAGSDAGRTATGAGPKPPASEVP